ncbi:MAG: DUF3847 domain-containing protein [Lachnospiraceae bacterium]|jgi:hypothetical protein|nr:DUF3847 domain-containing protein [Butyrivibrio sp.]MBR4342334.1 DUF3847 domain-containing protein [Lachnospiraceae bacterium]MBR6256334.1 DUF3847 domain-containing protein [Lachnospiraceae bacterium]
MSDFEEIDKAAKALEAAKKKREQAQHQVIREENRLETEEKKQRSKRTHMLCFKAAHLESIFPVVKDASKTDFIQFCDGLLRVPGVKEYAKTFSPKPIEEVMK